VIHEMNSEEWECGNDCLALICVFVTITSVSISKTDVDIQKEMVS
jgi:hypothetical protein